MKRLIAFLLCSLLLITLFAGCGKSDSDASGDGASTNSGDAQQGVSTEDISFFDEEGDSKYTIIRPEGVNETISKAATKIYSTLKKQLGLNIKNYDDFENGDDKWEILVGETNRPETAQAKELLKEGDGGRYNDYIICSIGKKIVILGATDEATLAAADYFTNNYISETISGGVNHVNRTEGDFSIVTVLGQNIRDVNIIRPHYNASYVMTVELDALTSYIREVSGYPVSVKEDRYEKPAEYEIIVGDAERDGVEDIEDLDEYSIKVDGNKIYLNGGSYYATAMAISEFTKALKAGPITADVAVKADYNDAVQAYDRSTRLNPTWWDEFEGNSVDLTKWNLFGPGDSDAKGANGKTSVRSKDPAVTYVYDGKFTIAAAQDDKYYYGGMLRSHNGKTNYKYGFIEMSAIIPYGPGFWVTLWMCGDNSEGAWSPEIDVDECYGNAVKVEGNYHSWPTSLGKEMGLEHKCYLHGGYWIPTRPEDDAHFGLAFHTYGYMWTDKWIGGTVDGNLYQQFDISEDPIYIDTFNDHMYLILSLACHFDNCPLAGTATEEQWENTNKLIVESIYIYQYFDGKSYLNRNIVG